MEKLSKNDFKGYGAGMIRDLHTYAAEIPNGQVELFDAFIAKLQLKYPELGK